MQMALNKTTIAAARVEQTPFQNNHYVNSIDIGNSDMTSDSWIVDTGASSHYNLIENLQNIKPINN